MTNTWHKFTIQVLTVDIIDRLYNIDRLYDIDMNKIIYIYY